MTTASIASSVLIPRPPRDVWDSLKRSGRLPGTVLSEAPAERVRFVHEGVRGWLPVGDVVGEYVLEPAAEGVRLDLSVTALVPDGDAGLRVRSLLSGWVSGSLAARAAELSPIRPAA